MYMFIQLIIVSISFKTDERFYHAMIIISQFNMIIIYIKTQKTKSIKTAVCQSVGIILPLTNLFVEN